MSTAHGSICAVAIALLAGAIGCSRRESSSCARGTLGCRCASSAALCVPSTDAPLVCDRGWCVPRDCIRGTEGCGCYANNTCDPVDGVPMTCESGLCRRSAIPAPGTLNGSCDADTPCETVEGDALVCVRGRCEVRGCPSATLGCPCGAYGACDAYGARQPMCSGGACVLADCEVGEDGCPCTTRGECTAGECRRGLCLAPAGQTVDVSGDVRACELVLDVGDAEDVEVLFDATVLGHERRRGARLAIAFTQTRDQPFGPSPVRITVTPRRSVARPTTAAALISAECFDRLGHRFDGALVRVSGGLP